MIEHDVFYDIFGDEISMVQIDSFWFSMVQIDFFWFSMVQIDSFWFSMVQIDSFKPTTSDIYHSYQAIKKYENNCTKISLLIDQRKTNHIKSRSWHVSYCS
jgi:hypothetical protein